MSDVCAIVTGCDQPFQARLAAALAERGMAVLAATAPGAAVALAAAVRPPGLLHRSDDLTTATGARALIEASRPLGQLQLLVNGASRSTRTPVTQSWQATVEAAAEVFDGNVLRMLLTARAAVPLLIASASAGMLNLTTLDVMPAEDEATNGPDMDLLSASHWALNGFTDAWSKTLREAGVRVNGLCLPDPIDAEAVEPALSLALALIDDPRAGENVAFDRANPGQLAPPRPRHRQITG